MKKIMGILLFILLPTFLYGGEITKLPTRAWQGYKSDLSKSLFLTFLWGGGFCDALQDAYTWSGGHTHFIVNEDNWHLIKNVSNVSYLATGITVAYNFGTKKWSVPGGLRTILGGLLIHQLIWDCTYRQARYSNPFDYRPEHNEHAIWYGDSNYIGLNEITGPLWDISRAFVGGFLLSR